MKKLIPAVVAILVISACLPTLPGNPTQTADVPPSSTSSNPTQTPLSAGTPASANPTVTPVLASATAGNPPTSNPSPDLTATLATSTDLPLNPTITSAVTSVPAGATLTPTLGILTYGTLPPAVPSNSITLWNRSKAQAYISLQVTTNDGQFAILEYPVEGQVRIRAPLGTYVYVAWVGGNKLTGGFRLTSTESLVILLYKDKVVIK